MGKIWGKNYGRDNGLTGNFTNYLQKALVYNLGYTGMYNIQRDYKLFCFGQYL